MGHIHPGFRRDRDKLPSVGVVAVAPDHGNIRAKSRALDSLVCTLASRSRPEFHSDNGLAGR